MLAEELQELHKREKEKGIPPEYDLDAFMTVDAVQGKKESLVSEHIIRILGLDVSWRSISSLWRPTHCLYTCTTV